MNVPETVTIDQETGFDGGSSWSPLSAGDRRNVAEGTLKACHNMSLFQTQSDLIIAASLLIDTFQMPKRSSTWPLDPSHDNTLPSASSDNTTLETLDDYSETSTELTEPWCPSFEPQPLPMSLNPLHVDAMHDACHLPWLSQGLCTTTSDIKSELR
jgi:hypothetical protein